MSRAWQIGLGTGVVLAIGWLLRSHAAQAAEVPAPAGTPQNVPDPNPSSPGVDTVNRTEVAGGENLGGVVLTPGYGLDIHDPDFVVKPVGKNLSTPEMQS